MQASFNCIKFYALTVKNPIDDKRSIYLPTITAFSLYVTEQDALLLLGVTLLKRRDYYFFHPHVKNSISMPLAKKSVIHALTFTHDRTNIYAHTRSKVRVFNTFTHILFVDYVVKSKLS